MRRAARRRASFAAATLQWKRCDVRESAGMSSGCTAGSRHVSAAASSRGAHAGCGEYRFGEGLHSGSSSAERFASFMGIIFECARRGLPPIGPAYTRAWMALMCRHDHTEIQILNLGQ